MKLVLVMFLEDEETAVLALLKRHGVAVYSHLPVEGHGRGLVGWSGEVSPYRSRLLFTVVPTEQASDLLEAVSVHQPVSDPAHPVHAWQVDVEAVAKSVQTTS